MKEEGGRGRRGGQKWWAYRHLLPETRTEPKFEFFAKKR